MSKRTPDRHLAENEVVFRQYNESIKRGFDEIRKMAKEDGQEHLIVDEDLPLHFFCECSDEDCHMRVVLKPSRYNEIHSSRDLFVVVNGHDTARIERVIEKHPGYSVVKKNVVPPSSAGTLHPTNIHNT